ncbi:Acidic leucine-rich nuclear phosphoprotein 32-related protein [Ananas comosus]|uniref:Acidic leucine-rich nuclear phosphoprotein 32-related protein n=1 Tax=Ananas comosus TaxID=4615 RepID=A0A199VJ25_ANACO|nr:Acidic leucine-rich nuclear phosphoprotein 32-related protein [Ananas comosus]
MDEAWERAVETALGSQSNTSAGSPPRSLTLDGAVKCLHGKLPPPEILERFQSLEHLSIANIGVSSLEKFPRLRNLTRLILSDNRIAGGLEFLVEAGLDALRDLDLSNNRIQFVEDLAPLAQMRLVSLDLYDPRGDGILDVDEDEESDADEEETEIGGRMEDRDGVEEEGEEEVDEEDDDEDDNGDGEEDEEDLENEEGREPGSTGRTMTTAEEEIDGHEQGEEDENGEIGEEDEQGVEEDREYQEDGEDDDEIHFILRAISMKIR